MTTHELADMITDISKRLWKEGVYLIADGGGIISIYVHPSSNLSADDFPKEDSGFPVQIVQGSDEEIQPLSASGSIDPTFDADAEAATCERNIGPLHNTFDAALRK